MTFDKDKKNPPENEIKNILKIINIEKLDLAKKMAQDALLKYSKSSILFNILGAILFKQSGEYEVHFIVTKDNQCVFMKVQEKEIIQVIAKFALNDSCGLRNVVETDIFKNMCNHSLRSFVETYSFPDKIEKMKPNETLGENLMFF